MTQLSPIFQKELDAFEKEFGDVKLGGGDSQDAFNKVMLKSFLLASLQRASLAVVEEIIDNMGLPPRFEQAQKIFNPHGRYDICTLCGYSPEGYRESTLATAKSIIGTNTGTLQG